MRTDPALLPLSDADAAEMLAALGSMPRLTVYRALMRAGQNGLNVTQLLEVTRMPGSTLKHHLSALVEAGLVGQEKVSREVYSMARFDEVRRLSSFLIRECCADENRLVTAINATEVRCPG